MGQPERGEWLADDLITESVLEGTAELARLDSSSLPCSPMARSSSKVTPQPGTAGPLRQRWSQAARPPLSQWPLLGLGPVWGVRGKAWPPEGQQQSRREPCAGRLCAGPGPAPELHVSGPLHEGRGQDKTAL